MKAKEGDVTELSCQIAARRIPEKRDQADSNLPRHHAVAELLFEGIEGYFLNASGADQIWRAESSHRAQGLLQLMLFGKFQTSKNRIKSESWILESGLVQNLTDAYHSLSTSAGCEGLPCEESVQLIVQGLLSTFRNTIGAVELALHTRPLIVAARERRALALLIGQLVIALLLDKAQRNADARLTLTISTAENGHASVKVETSCPLSHSLQAPGYDIVCALAGIMGGEILFRKARSGGTSVEIVVPQNS